jgi:hypothetical protein
VDPQLHEGESNFGFRCCDAEIACESHAHPSAWEGGSRGGGVRLEAQHSTARTDGVAVDGGDGGDAEVTNGEEQVVEADHGLVI